MLKVSRDGVFEDGILANQVLADERRWGVLSDERRWGSRRLAQIRFHAAKITRPKRRSVIVATVAYQ